MSPGKEKQTEIKKKKKHPPHKPTDKFNQSYVSQLHLINGHKYFIERFRHIVLCHDIGEIIFKLIWTPEWSVHFGTCSQLCFMCSIASTLQPSHCSLRTADFFVPILSRTVWTAALGCHYLSWRGTTHKGYKSWHIILCPASRLASIEPCMLQHSPLQAMQ